MLAYLLEYNDFSFTIYYCGKSDWCNNPNHAHKFPTREEAEAKAKTMRSTIPLTVAEHRWVDDSAHTAFNQAKEVLTK